ncbi:MAG: hypothetical protein AAGE52_38330 [Myxococcota bacterium]
MRLLWVLAAVLVGCSSGSSAETDAGGTDGGALPQASRLFRSAEFRGCAYASPRRFDLDGRALVLAAEDIGIVHALDAATGDEVWSLEIAPELPAQDIYLLSTPAIFGERALFGWQEVIGDQVNRVRHRVRVVDLRTGTWDEAYEPLDLEGRVPAADGSGEVVFDSLRQLMRSEIEIDGDHAFVPLGNGPSRQPFHGWIFELDLNAWRDGSASDAIAALLCTTAENDCGPTGSDSPMRCGGGVWNAAGMVSYEDEGETFWLVPTGNGRIDYDRGAYAHSVLRVQRGLAFSSGCDPALCDPMDELNPDPACFASCENVFSAHLPPGAPDLAPEDGTCDGLGFVECYGALDADLGASSPVVTEVPGGPPVIIQPGKDGALYLIDRERMGRLYQRLQVMDFCGTLTDDCRAFWIGTFVTHPVVVDVGGERLVIVVGIVADRTHPAGLTAFRLSMVDGEPRLSMAWQTPSFSSPEAQEVFRHTSGRPVIVNVDGEPYVVVVEARRGDGASPPGTLWGVRARDGAVVFREDVSGAGQRFAVPDVDGTTVYLTTCNSGADREGRIEAWRLR